MKEDLETPKIRQLLDHGLDVNEQDAYGMTVLHLAASAGNVAAITFLLSRNADPNLRDDQDLLPLDVANNDEARNILGRVSMVRYS